ncbi:site-specific integrase [Nostoc sp. UHCC 0870]|uniref:site-specific integrase n=1 Tax=Nostoc sp. UHCC 0870 TaxID=2914041 RepID=UPI001EE0C5D2|nr:site-specific integrase [Nostoc sp. UHCC 0870]UKO99384.1 site-specific integrase [Nostoc sp. UHCC 0870]
MRELKVRKNGSRCLLRWTYQGIDYSLTWGKWNDKVERARLEYCGKLIYQDCLVGEFDNTLNKYNLWLQGIVYSGNGGPKPTAKFPPLVSLLEERLEETYNDADSALINLLKSFGKEITNSKDAQAFMKWLTTRGLKASSRKRYLAILQAVRRDLFGELEVKVAQTPRAKPFTRAEVKQILNYLQESQHYSHYHDLICLLFNTGLRTSEAIGLQWKHVDLEKGELHIYESLGRSKGSSSVRERKTTKTGKYRIVPINDTVLRMLQERPKKGQEELLFPSPTGLPIDDHNLSQRCWRNTLKALGIAHRPLYNTRHTFVSHCVDSGLTVAEVSSITGHNPKILLDHYLGSVKKPKLPEL